MCVSVEGRVGMEGCSYNSFLCVKSYNHAETVV